MPILGKCPYCSSAKDVILTNGACGSAKCQEAAKKPKSIEAVKGSLIVPAPKKQKQINKVSDKQKERLKAYNKARKEFLALPENKFCQVKVKGCTMKATQVHHIRGRIGRYLTLKKKFLAICQNCHEHVETHPDEAKERGWSESRLKKDNE